MFFPCNSLFQGQGCDRGQHSVTDTEMLWGIVLIIPWKCQFFSKHPALHMPFPLPSVNSLLPEITCPLRPNLNITSDVMPSRTRLYHRHPTYHLSPALINTYWRLLLPTPPPAQTLSSWDTLLSDAASLFKFKYIPVDTKCYFSSDLASMLHFLSEPEIAFLNI